MWGRKVEQRKVGALYASWTEPVSVSISVLSVFWCNYCWLRKVDLTSSDNVSVKKSCWMMLNAFDRASFSFSFSPNCWLHGVFGSFEHLGEWAPCGPAQWPLCLHEASQAMGTLRIRMKRTTHSKRGETVLGKLIELLLAEMSELCYAGAARAWAQACKKPGRSTWASQFLEVWG